MNFTYLVDSGKYTQEMLTADEKRYISGMEEAVTEIDTFLAMESEELDADSVLDQIRLEIMQDTCMKLQAHLHSAICESIVVLVDRHESGT